MRSIEVIVLESDTAAQHQEQLQRLFRLGWGLAWNGMAMAEGSSAAKWGAILKYDHGKHLELASLRETVTAHTRQIEWIQRWIQQQRSSSDAGDDTQLINPFSF